MIIDLCKCSCGGVPSWSTQYIKNSRNYIAKITCGNCGETITGTSKEFHNMAMRKAAAEWNHEQKIPEGV